MGDDKLTSVKIDNTLFEAFKINAVRNKFTFQKLAERAMWLYINNEEFRNQIHNQFDTTYTGSI